VAQGGGDTMAVKCKSGNSMHIIIKARIDAETSKRIAEYCKKTGKTRTDLVRESIIETLDKSEQRPQGD
jgi:predicted DNA-binding protein